MLADDLFRMVERGHEHTHIIGFAMFPSDVAALRFNPRSLARFIGDPLNDVRNSSSLIATISCASVWHPSPR